MIRFKVGDKVRWFSVSGGYGAEKEGVVAEVVAPGDRPDRERFKKLYSNAG